MYVRKTIYTRLQYAHVVVSVYVHVNVHYVGGT